MGDRWTSLWMIEMRKLCPWGHFGWRSIGSKYGTNQSLVPSSYSFDIHTTKFILSADLLQIAASKQTIQKLSIFHCYQIASSDSDRDCFHGSLPDDREKMIRTIRSRVAFLFDCCFTDNWVHQLAAYQHQRTHCTIEQYISSRKNTETVIFCGVLSHLMV